jgi:hypothetical protein
MHEKLLHIMYVGMFLIYIHTKYNCHLGMFIGYLHKIEKKKHAFRVSAILFHSVQK